MTKDDTPRVYVMQEVPNRDFTKAAKFGKIVFLTAREPTQYGESPLNADIMQEVATGLLPYRAGVDFVIPSGSPIVMAMCMMIIGRAGNKIKMLQWHNRERVYNEFVLDLDWLRQEACVVI